MSAQADNVVQLHKPRLVPDRMHPAAEAVLTNTYFSVRDLIRDLDLTREAVLPDAPGEEFSRTVLGRAARDLAAFADLLGSQLASGETDGAA